MYTSGNKIEFINAYCDKELYGELVFFNKLINIQEIVKVSQLHYESFNKTIDLQ